MNTKKKRTWKIGKKKGTWPMNVDDVPKGVIFVSPDGGETVFIQKKNGERGKMVSQSQLAKDIEVAYDENEMEQINYVYSYLAQVCSSTDFSGLEGYFF